ncbi:hypothetical protein ACFLS4_05250, partial [Bacteroidota bacterium]
MKQLKLFVLILFTLLTACVGKESENQENDHDHGDVKLIFTQYTDNYELFIETDPFIKGQTSSILAHFTQLSNFKPLKANSITANLITGKSEIKQTVKNSVNTGIYQFSLQPEVNGAGKLIFEIETDNGEYKITLDNVVVYGDEHTAILIAEKKEIVNVNAINFTKEQSWKIDFETITPYYESFGKIIKSTAHVLNDRTNETIVTSKTNGAVQFYKNIFEGQNVNTSDILLSISGKGLANDNAEIRFLEAKNNFELAKSDYDRKLALSQNQIVSEKELENAKREYENAKAVYDNLRQNFSSNGQNVISSQKG